MTTFTRQRTAQRPTRRRFVCGLSPAASGPEMALEQWRFNGHDYDVLMLALPAEQFQRALQARRARRFATYRPGTPARRRLETRFARELAGELGWPLTRAEDRLLATVEDLQR